MCGVAQRVGASFYFVCIFPIYPSSKRSKQIILSSHLNILQNLFFCDFRSVRFLMKSFASLHIQSITKTLSLFIHKILKTQWYWYEMPFNLRVEKQHHSQLRLFTFRKRLIKYSSYAPIWHVCSLACVLHNKNYLFAESSLYFLDFRSCAYEKYILVSFFPMNFRNELKVPIKTRSIHKFEAHNRQQHFSWVCSFIEWMYFDSRLKCLMIFFVSNQNYIQFLIDYYRIGFQQLKFKTICNLHIKIPSSYMMLLVSCCWWHFFFIGFYESNKHQYVIGAQLTAIKHISRISRRTSCFNIQNVLCTHFFFSFYKITCVKYIQITFAFLKSRKKNVISALVEIRCSNEQNPKKKSMIF